jgi:hypothetical protein
MKTGALAVLVIGLLVPATLEAQRNGNRGRRPNDVCRVWYDRLPANRQPAPMNCRQAENIARRDRSARVIYGSDSSRQGDAAASYPDRFLAVVAGTAGPYSQGYGWGMTRA